MKNKLLEKLYDIFYTTPDFPLQSREAEEGRKALGEALDKQKYRLVLQIIDAKDSIIEKISVDSFIAGFELAWQLAAEVHHDESERFSSLQDGSLGARFISKTEERL